jgi:hypothetical protein
LTPVADLLGRVTPNHGVDWADLVGAMLGGLSVPLGVNDAGVLRVMAINETAQREIEARSDGLMDVWNTAARHEGAREATSVQCWVHEGLRPRTGQRGVEPRAPEPRPVPAGVRADADAMTGPVVNASVREALVEMRAKALVAEALEAGDEG